jgi:hypothetical protein
MLLHPAGALVSINSETSRMESLHLPAAPVSDAEAAVSLLANFHGGLGTRPGLLSAPTVSTITSVRSSTSSTSFFCYVRKFWTTLERRSCLAAARPGQYTLSMFEQAFKNIDDVLWKEAGCTTELDYTEQTSWLLFLKYLDGLEQDKADEAALHGKKYTFILDAPYRWEAWAAPKGKDGKLDHNTAKTGDDLRDFVNQKLFPYLHGFKQKATGPNTIEYKIGEIFGEIKNKISSGYNLREIIDHIDELRFRSQTEKHELSHLYEAKIRNMGNAGRNGGDYYTPRPLIRAMVEVVKPRIGPKQLAKRSSVEISSSGYENRAVPVLMPL